MDSHWLKIQFKNHPEKTKAELAKALGLEPPAISKILANTRQIKAKEYAIMRRFFGLSVDEAQNLQMATRTSKMIPANYSSLCEEPNANTHAAWNIPDHVIQKRVTLAPQHIKIYQVSEDLMEPKFFKGEYIALDTSDKKVSKPGVFMISDGYSMMLRHCEMSGSEESSEIHISAYRPDFQTQIIPPEDIQIIGRVIAKMQWV